MLQKIILASSSPSRLALLKQINIVPDHIHPPEIDETALEKEKLADMAKRLAKEKCLKVCELYPQDVVIAADTVSVVARHKLRKTYDANQAYKNLQAISGKRHRLYTSLVVGVKNQDILVQKTIMSILKFKKLSAQELEEYIDSKQWQGCSGSYALEGLAAKYVSWMSGSFSNILGLPLYELNQILSGINIKIKGYNDK